MISDRSDYTNENLINAIRNGCVSIDEIKEKTKSLIINEMEQENHPADPNLISACNDILCETYHLQSHDQQLQSKTAALQKLNYKSGLSKRRYTYVGKFAAIVVILIITGFLFENLMPVKYLTGFSTTDEQNYIISGEKSNTNLVVTASANQGQNLKSISAASLEEITSSVGHTPSLPAWLPEGWTDTFYFASNSRFSSEFTVQYSNPDETDSLVYNITSYNDATSATTVFEQSQTGEIFKVNGLSLYITKNVNNTSVVWINNMNCYSLSGPINIDDAIAMIQSIQYQGD